MTILVAVAVGVPCLGVLAFLGMRRIQSLPFARSLALARSGDMRGIALQTIIIIVVLLAIAGSVAAVLLNRAGEVTGELEAQDVTLTTVDTATECAGRTINTHGGIWTAATNTCVWTGNASNPISATQCGLVRGPTGPGTRTAGTGGHGVCTTN